MPTGAQRVARGKHPEELVQRVAVVEPVSKDDQCFPSLRDGSTI